MTNYWTEDDIRAACARMGTTHLLGPVGSVQHEGAPLGLHEPTTTLTQRPYAPYRSRTEQRYAQDVLAVWAHDGAIVRWRYEAVRLQLAPQTTLTPDFLLTLPDGRMQFHEVKGFAREDAMVKLKIAARLWPEYLFYLVRWHRGSWLRTLIPSQ